MNAKLQTTPGELFMLIGEREFVNFKLNEKVKELLFQIDEMAKVITSLREQNGRLEQSTNNDAV